MAPLPQLPAAAMPQPEANNRPPPQPVIVPQPLVDPVVAEAAPPQIQGEVAINPAPPQPLPFDPVIGAVPQLPVEVVAAPPPEPEPVPAAPQPQVAEEPEAAQTPPSNWQHVAKTALFTLSTLFLGPGATASLAAPLL